MAKSLTLIAINQIHRTLKAGEVGDKSKGIRPTPPKIQIIEPRSVFNALDEDDYEELTSGTYPAARKPEKEDNVRVSAENQISDEDQESAASLKAAAKKQADADKKAKAEKAAEDKKAADDKKAAEAAKNQTTSGSTKTSANAGTTKSGSTASGSDDDNLV